MSEQKNIATFSSGFNPSEILNLKSGKSGMEWKDSMIRSPILVVKFPPRPSQNKSSEYSVGLRIASNYPNYSTSLQLFKDLVDTAQKKAVQFMLDEKNGNRYAKKTFSSEKEFKVSKFWYDNDTFYMKFRLSVPVHLFDQQETKKLKENGSDKKAYKPVTDNIVNYLGENSLISVDFLPNAFFIKDKDILYPFALNIEKIIIWTHSENVKEELSYKKHSYLSGFGMNVEYKGI